MNWNEDKWQKGEADKPRYVVVGHRVGTPFYAPEYAVAWQEKLRDEGVKTQILDLTNYDWEKNLAGFKFHALRPEGRN